MDPIKKITNIETAVSKMKQLISSGKLSSGKSFPSEKELSETLDVGRSAVREAVVVLQALGYIEIRRDTGEIVVKSNEDTPESTTHWFAEHVEQMSDYMEARQAIEVAAVRLAVQRASDIEIEQLEGIHSAFQKAMTDNDVAGLAESDKAFHQTIIRATHNKVLIIINHKLEEAFDKYRIKSFAISESRPRTLQQHRNIIAAIEKRDAAAAEREMMHHLDIAHRDLYGLT
jgi:GntR family transcriptional repressor for pyruvate dehydrogenase complex